MTCDLDALTFDARDPVGLGRFWAGLLDRELVQDPHAGTAVLPGDQPGFRIRFVPSQATKEGPNPMHFDLTSESVEGQRATVAKAERLGGHPVDIGQGADAAHEVMADPEGNEFDVIEPGNAFLAGCGVIGALACDGSQQVGYFWSEALAWPLVWDQDQETAIQSPQGGPKITWGGPPLNPRRGKNRVHFDLVPSLGADQQAEVERLLSLGATLLDIGQGSVAWTVMADPDGNEFCVWPGLGR